MGTIKLKRGTGSPAGSIEANEVAMDVAAKNLYTSTNGSDAVVLADNTVNTLSGISATLDISDKVAIEGTAGSINWGTGVIGASILNLKTDNSGWDKGQITLEDSNAKVMKMVGENNTGQSVYKYVILMDPDGGNNPSGGYTGDYGFYYNKDYSGTIKMQNNVFGAKDGFEMSIHDDYDGGSPNPGPFGSPGAGFPGYGYKPFRIFAEQFDVYSKDSDTSTAQSLSVDKDSADFSVPVVLGSKASDPGGTNGMMYYNSTSNKFRMYQDGAWMNVDGT